MTNIKNCVGKNLKAYRKSNNLTQEQLSVIVDLDYRTVGYIEQGRYLGRVDTLQKIIDSLGLTIDDLFSDKTIEFDDNTEQKLRKINKRIKELPPEKMDAAFEIFEQTLESISKL